MEERKNDKDALEQLKELKPNDKISSLDFVEPELKGFDISNVFDIENVEPQPEKKKFSFGKRANRHAAKVTIKTNEFDNEPLNIEDISLNASNTAKETPVVEEGLVNEIIEEPKPNQELESSNDVFFKLEELSDEDYENAEYGDDDFNQEDMQEIPVENVLINQEENEEDEKEDVEFEEEVIEDDEDIYDEERDELYYEKTKYLMSQYEKMEAYLEKKSKEGYHFVRRVGKKSYFFHSKPANYYYSINYFSEEPSAEQWREWEADGWKLVSRAPSNKRRDAGWLIFRNTEKKNQPRKVIENDDEKYRFYRKHSNSCRSTMFFMFMCMAICAVAALMQFKYKGYVWGFVVCGTVFFFAFILFCIYGRMLRNSKKVCRSLQAKIRTRERRAAFYAEHTFDTSESEEDLDSDWDTLESEISQTQHGTKKRRKK